jgi:hypothetical protein
MNNKPRSGFTSVVIALVIGMFLGAAGTYTLIQKDAADAAALQAAQPEKAPPAGANDDDYFSRKLREWNLDTDGLRGELDRAGRIIRERGRELGTRVAEETSDVRIVAVIKAKYTLDDELSAWDISVDCKQGHVTLTGFVRSADQVGRAIVLALDTDGVADVDSSLRVKGDGAENTPGGPF